MENSNKKMMIIITVLIIALVSAILTIFIVLVTPNQKANTSVNIKYTAEEVSVRLLANAYVGTNAYEFTLDGKTDGGIELLLSPENNTGALSQQENTPVFNLSRTNPYIVFEYIFINETEDIDVNIDLVNYPGNTVDGVKNGVSNNIKLTYLYSDTQIDNFKEVQSETKVSNILLPAYANETTTKYVYIKAEIDDLLYDSEFNGNFHWALSKPTESNITTITLNVAGADYIERAGSSINTTNGIAETYTYRTTDTEVEMSDINIYPAVANKRFMGWAGEANATEVADNIPESKVLYPVYMDGNIPEEHYAVASTYAYITGTLAVDLDNAVIPDIIRYSVDNTDKIFKITNVRDDFNADFMIIENLYIGNYVEDIGYLSFAGILNNIIFGRSLHTIGDYVFAYSEITECSIPDSVISIGESAFEDCYNLENLYLGSDVESIGFNAFYMITANKLTNITVSPYNGYFDSRDNCNAIINTGDDEIIVASINTIIPKDVKIIGVNSFSMLKISSIHIPNSVKEIKEGAFARCAKLTKFVLPASVEKVGIKILISCDKCVDISVESGNRFYDSRDNCNAIIDSVSNELITAASRNVVIPDTVVSLAKFSLFGYQQTLIIPESVTYIDNSALGMVLNLIFEDVEGWQILESNVWKDIDIESFVSTLGGFNFQTFRKL